MLFQFLKSRHHLVSKCQKDGLTIIADTSTPKNIMPTVEDAEVLPQERRASSTRRRSRVDEGPSSSTIKDDRDTIHRTPQERKKDDEGGVQEGKDAPPVSSDGQGQLQSLHPVTEPVS